MTSRWYVIVCVRVCARLTPPPSFLESSRFRFHAPHCQCHGGLTTTVYLSRTVSRSRVYRARLEIVFLVFFLYSPPPAVILHFPAGNHSLSRTSRAFLSVITTSLVLEKRSAPRPIRTTQQCWVIRRELISLSRRWCHDVLLSRPNHDAVRACGWRGDESATSRVVDRTVMTWWWIFEINEETIAK